MDKYIGRLLDNRYEILEVLGTGGMAVVYKARCHRLNRLVAIKILKDDYLEDEEFRRRFHSESQAVAMFSHPNIVSVYDVSTSVTADYIVMELIEGITLKQYMEKKGVLNWKETLHFAIQIAKALEHAHSRGIVHRDIKPHNVMVLKNGSVKVTDFGIARMMSKGNTLTKEALGSVHYISPEQAKGGRVDSRSDIYSLGVVMYEMMTGRPPYDGESPVAVAIQHINGGAAMPTTLNPNIPGGLEQIIMRAMAYQLGDRYESATQMLADMDEFRKNPTILFDYNTPPLDDVIKISKPPLVLDSAPAETTAERVARRSQGQRRQQGQRRSADMERSRQEAARRRAEAAAEESRSRVATIAIVACSVVMVVAVVIFLIVLLGGGNVSQPKLIEVPNLIGADYKALPQYPGFEIRLNDEVHDDEYEAGCIIDQNPKAGEMVADPNDIFVTVSLGPAPKTVYMPDLVNKESNEANRMLDNLMLNLNVVINEEFSETVVADKVIRTDPAVNAELKTGQTVTLYVSKGPEIQTTEMPDLRERPLEDAQKILENKEMKLEITVEEVYDAQVEFGVVIKTVPEQGQELQTGQKVIITVSKGPQKAKMPDVRERNIADAVSMLATAGFSDYGIESEHSEVEKDRVIDQSVAPDEEVEITTKIILKVSKGPAEETVQPVTKNVTIDLRGAAEGGECEVKVTRDGQLVFSQKVPQGTVSVVLENQTSDAPVKYVVILNDQEGFDHWEEFKAG